jgi:hypothetical protein
LNEHDAEGGVPDDHRGEPEPDAERVKHSVERSIECDSRDDSGQRDRQDHQEADGRSAEEVVPLDLLFGGKP